MPFTGIKAVIALLGACYLLQVCCVWLWHLLLYSWKTFFFFFNKTSCRHMHKGNLSKALSHHLMPESGGVCTCSHPQFSSLATIHCKCLVPNQASVHWHPHFDYTSDTGFSYLCLYQQDRQTESADSSLFGLSCYFLIFKWEDLNRSPNQSRSSNRALISLRKKNFLWSEKT